MRELKSLDLNLAQALFFKILEKKPSNFAVTVCCAAAN